MTECKIGLGQQSHVGGRMRRQLSPLRMAQQGQTAADDALARQSAMRQDVLHEIHTDTADQQSRGGLTIGISKLAQSRDRSEEHTSEPQSLMRNSYAVFCLKKKNTNR